MTMNPEQIKKEYPVFRKRIKNKKLVYFDNACGVLKPYPVIDEINKYYRYMGGCGGSRSSHHLSWHVQEEIEVARKKLSAFINARFIDEIIWTKNSTEGINLVAGSFPFTKKRNEVVLTLFEHHSMLLPFYGQGKQRNFKVKIVAPNKKGWFDLHSFEKAINEKTGLVAITQLSNTTGLPLPVKEIAALAHKRGAKILIDAAQYVSTHREDVLENNADFLVFSGHKIGGPTGTGVLYAKRSCQELLSPLCFGGGTVESVKIRENRLKAKFLPAPVRFEAGIQNYSGIMGLKAASAFIGKLGIDKISGHTKELCSYALSKLYEVPEVGFLVDYQKEAPSNLFSFYFKKGAPALYDFNLFLNHGIKGHFIAVRSGHHCAQPLHDYFKQPFTMRLSFFAYNSKPEIDIFVKALKQFLGKNR